MYDISLTMPAIRTNNWVSFFNSAVESCRDHTFELVIVSPFELPKELKDKPNIQHILDKGNPSRATQIANINAKGRLIMNCVDDGVFTNNVLDWAIDYFNTSCDRYDVINMRYREESSGRGCEFPPHYWRAWNYEDFRKPSIHPIWNLAMHFVMKKETYIELGGIDCQFEYSNHGIHDLIFRIQALGGKVYNSALEGLNCTHYPGRTMDHAPVHDAQTTHDKPLFDLIYNDSQAPIKRRILDINNWKDSPMIWDRRFSGEVRIYEDLLK